MAGYATNGVELVAVGLEAIGRSQEICAGGWWMGGGKRRAQTGKDDSRKAQRRPCRSRAGKVAVTGRMRSVRAAFVPPLWLRGRGSVLGGPEVSRNRGSTACNIDHPSGRGSTCVLGCHAKDTAPTTLAKDRQHGRGGGVGGATPA